MLIIDTLSQQELIQLMNGNVVGIFDYLFKSSDTLYNKRANLSTGYYVYHSGNKAISATYNRIYELIEFNPDTITKSANEIIAGIIRDKFIEKWNKIYNALNSDYNPLDDFNFTEQKSGDNTDTTTYGSKKAKTGDNTDTMTYDTTTTDDRKTSTKETTTRSTSSNDDVYGFNSTDGVPDTKSQEDITETLAGNKEDNNTTNVNTKQGTDTHGFSINENESKTGADTLNKTIDETVTRNGRNTKPSELITDEIRLRNEQIFFDIIYNDIDTITALQIYI